MLRFMLRSLSALLIFAFLACTANHATAATVTNLQMMRHPDGMTRLVLDIDNAVAFRSFALNNPLRMVIDLPRMTWRAPMNKGDRNGFVKSYRTGIYKKDTLRLVLDLGRPVVVAQQQRVAAPNGRGWQYIFDLKPVDPITFQRSLQQIKADSNTATASTAPTDRSYVVTPPKPQAPTQTASVVIKKPLIIIDPGHGGVDPGALAANRAYEKHITLAVGKELARLLQASGRYRVKMTRDRDVYIKLPERVRIARAAGGDLFISLHADTIGRSNVSGCSVYTLSDTASDAETAKLAERENAVDSLVNVNVGHVDADVADILIDLVTRDTMNQSRVLAETVVTTFKGSGIRTLPQRPHRSAGFAVLKAPDIPSILIEMGFLSNKVEADQLSSDPYRKKLANAILRVIDRYFNETSKTAAY